MAGTSVCLENNAADGRWAGFVGSANFKQFDSVTDGTNKTHPAAAKKSDAFTVDFGQGNQAADQREKTHEDGEEKMAGNLSRFLPSRLRKNLSDRSQKSKLKEGDEVQKLNEKNALGSGTSFGEKGKQSAPSPQISSGLDSKGFHSAEQVEKTGLTNAKRTPGDAPVSSRAPEKETAKQHEQQNGSAHTGTSASGPAEDEGSDAGTYTIDEEEEQAKKSGDAGSNKPPTQIEQEFDVSSESTADEKVTEFLQKGTPDMASGAVVEQRTSDADRRMYNHDDNPVNTQYTRELNRRLHDGSFSTQGASTAQPALSYADTSSRLPPETGSPLAESTPKAPLRSNPVVTVSAPSRVPGSPPVEAIISANPAQEEDTSSAPVTNTSRPDGPSSAAKLSGAPEPLVPPKRFVIGGNRTYDRWKVTPPDPKQAGVTSPTAEPRKVPLLSNFEKLKRLQSLSVSVDKVMAGFGRHRSVSTGSGPTADNTVNPNNNNNNNLLKMDPKVDDKLLNKMSKSISLSHDLVKRVQDMQARKSAAGVGESGGACGKVGAKTTRELLSPTGTGASAAAMSRSMDAGTAARLLLSPDEDSGSSSDTTRGKGRSTSMIESGPSGSSAVATGLRLTPTAPSRRHRRKLRVSMETLLGIDSSDTSTPAPASAQAKQTPASAEPTRVPTVSGSIDFTSPPDSNRSVSSNGESGSDLAAPVRNGLTREDNTHMGAGSEHVRQSKTLNDLSSITRDIEQLSEAASRNISAAPDSVTRSGDEDLDASGELPNTTRMVRSSTFDASESPLRSVSDTIDPVHHQAPPSEHSQQFSSGSVALSPDANNIAYPARDHQQRTPQWSQENSRRDALSTIVRGPSAQEAVEQDQMHDRPSSPPIPTLAKQHQQLLRNDEDEMHHGDDGAGAMDEALAEGRSGVAMLRSTDDNMLRRNLYRAGAKNDLVHAGEDDRTSRPSPPPHRPHHPTSATVPLRSGHVPLGASSSESIYRSSIFRSVCGSEYGSEYGDDEDEDPNRTYQFKRTFSTGIGRPRPNRALELRRQRLGLDLPKEDVAAGSKDQGKVENVAKQSPVATAAASKKPDARPSPGSKGQTSNFRRSDGGRHSMRVSSSTEGISRYAGAVGGGHTKTSAAKASAAVEARKEKEKDSRFVSSKPEPDEKTMQEKKAWQRRSKYDPRKAVQDAKEKKKEEKEHEKQKQQRQDDPSASSPLRRSASFNTHRDLKGVHRGGGIPPPTAAGSLMHPRYQKRGAGAMGRGQPGGGGFAREIAQASKELSDKLGDLTQEDEHAAEDLVDEDKDLQSPGSDVTESQPDDSSVDDRLTAPTPADTVRSMLYSSLRNRARQHQNIAVPVSRPSPSQQSRHRGQHAPGRSTTPQRDLDSPQHASDRGVNRRPSSETGIPSPAGRHLQSRDLNSRSGDQVPTSTSDDSEQNLALSPTVDDGQWDDSASDLTSHSTPQPSRHSLRNSTNRGAVGPTTGLSNGSSKWNNLGGIGSTVQHHDCSSDSSSTVSDLQASIKASYDQLVVSSIYNMTVKLRTNTQRSVAKLRDSGCLHGVVLPPDIDSVDQVTTPWQSANQQLTAVLANLLKVDQHLHVINKGLGRSLAATVSDRNDLGQSSSLVTNTVLKRTPNPGRTSTHNEQAEEFV